MTKKEKDKLQKETDKLIAELAEEDKQEAAELIAENKKLYARGFRYWVVAWVHPKGGGDDYMIDIYEGKLLNRADIHAILKKKRSSVLDDYGQFKLNPDGTSEPVNTPLNS